MLNREALKVSRWKKRVAWNLYQRRDLKRADILHATSESEAQDFRKRNLSQPIAIVPNGVDVPVGIQRPEDSGSQGANFTAGGRELFANRPREAGGSALVKTEKPRTLLFLSRLHPIKGLKDLVTAWASVRPKGWRVVIAGPNETIISRRLNRWPSHLEFAAILNSSDPSTTIKMENLLSQD